MNIKWEEIEGYREDMTAEEKLALLDKVPDPKPAPTTGENTFKGYVPKKDFDKTASELAALKKQLRAHQNEEENARQDREEEHNALIAELEGYRKSVAIAEDSKSFLALGYDAKLAEETAKAWAEGDKAAVFTSIKTYKDQFEKALRAQILKGTPTPPAGDDVKKAKDLAEYKAIREAMGLKNE